MPKIFAPLALDLILPPAPNAAPVIEEVQLFAMRHFNELHHEKAVDVGSESGIREHRVEHL